MQEPIQEKYSWTTATWCSRKNLKCIHHARSSAPTLTKWSEKWQGPSEPDLEPAGRRCLPRPPCHVHVKNPVTLLTSFDQRAIQGFVHRLSRAADSVWCSLEAGLAQEERRWPVEPHCDNLRARNPKVGGPSRARPACVQSQQDFAVHDHMQAPSRLPWQNTQAHAARGVPESAVEQPSAPGMRCGMEEAGHRAGCTHRPGQRPRPQYLRPEGPCAPCSASKGDAEVFKGRGQERSHLVLEALAMQKPRTE
mmetsp:Transcript_34057/g.97982  ORF Transcript_34057/g.97982 Transcript_34057/m.97982 type:complete len:251 (-) Transcript_34057:319-1071(-)